VAFFCYGTAHATGPNRTGKERAGLAIHFLHTDYAQPGLVEANRTTRPYLTGPEATGGLREYGVKVEGTWEQEVERVLAEAGGIR
jgi:ectoine hydroxylase-related dioxygenase (phytanoyl-CoA dioxygenase family)